MLQYMICWVPVRSMLLSMLAPMRVVWAIVHTFRHRQAWIDICRNTSSEYHGRIRYLMSLYLEIIMGCH